MKYTERIDGAPISDFGFEMRREGDLLYYEGPLLSHFVNKEDNSEHYFYKWADFDDAYNRRFVFRVSKHNLLSFFEKAKNLLQLIRENPFVYFIDLDDNLNKNNLLLCSNDKIPFYYLPLENSYFDETQFEKYAITLKDKIIKEERLDYFKNKTNINLITGLKEEVWNSHQAIIENYRSMNKLEINMYIFDETGKISMAKEAED